MWPKEILDALDVALPEVTLTEGYTKAEAIVKFLDTAAAMAVWRCKAEPEHLETAYFFPYTPIGHLTASGMAGTMTTVMLSGPEWHVALTQLKEFVRARAPEICERFKDNPQPYPHEVWHRAGEVTAVLPTPPES